MLDIATPVVLWNADLDADIAMFRIAGHQPYPHLSSLGDKDQKILNAVGVQDLHALDPSSSSNSIFSVAYPDGDFNWDSPQGVMAQEQLNTTEQIAITKAIQESMPGRLTAYTYSRDHYLDHTLKPKDFHKGLLELALLKKLENVSVN